MPLPVTSLYAGIMGLWLMYLGFQVVRERRKHNVSTGDGGVRALALAMRAHGNACEYVPIALILLGLAEGMGAPAWVLHLFGIAFGVGRFMHGWYFLAGARVLKVRQLGMLLTVGAIGALAFGVIFHALAQMA